MCDFAVAPLAGAWIEIVNEYNEFERLYPSLPSRERGLKLKITSNQNRMFRRSPRGSVD